MQRSHGFNCQLPAGKGHMEPATEQRAWVRCPHLPSAVFPAAAGETVEGLMTVSPQIAVHERAHPPSPA